MKAIQIEAFGNPGEVVKAVDVPDVGVPAAGEGVIALETSPINQYDILMIAGGYGYRPRPPAIMARKESAAAVGARVKHLKEGDRTLVPFLHPTWAERIKTGAPWLRPLPPGDINQFAMMGVNPPTAYLLLTDINEIAARTLGDPEWRHSRYRAGNRRDREIAWIEDSQYRPS